MGKIGLGYGSEWHLLWYLGRHRTELSVLVRQLTGADRVEWLDFPVRKNAGKHFDEEWKGLDFLDNASILSRWRAFWPQGSGIQNWDAIARLTMRDRDEWLLVEAKGHCAEIVSRCGAKPEGGRGRIEKALEATKRELGVEKSRDWLTGYYQFCNRLAVLKFLREQGVAARLLFIYFTSDSTPGRDCPADEAGWRAALEAQATHVGLPAVHPLADRLHKLFLPVFANVRSNETV
jgi:hypothetical protein